MRLKAPEGTQRNSIDLRQLNYFLAVVVVVSLANLLFERYTAYDNTGSVASAKISYSHTLFLHVAKFADSIW